jgi:hypothetical protein
MADSYLSIAAAADNYSMQRRVAACAAQEGVDVDPWQWTVDSKYGWASAPGWGAAWDSALAAHPDDPEYDPGADPVVITDGMILSQVQGMLGGGG